jgi:hypothetical protein
MSNEDKSVAWRDTITLLVLLLLPTPFQAIGVIVMWLIARWSYVAKWAVTLLVVINLAIFSRYSFNAYEYYKYQKSYTPLMSLQQSVDIYGIANGKYPQKLDDLRPKYILDIPSGLNLSYTVAEDGKSYTLKATIEGKDVELRPAFTQIPGK